MKSQLPACIFFDLDGTLVDSLPGIEFSVREAFRACKLPEPKESLREIIGPPIRSILSRAGKVVEESRLDALERAFRASYDSEGWQMAVCFPNANDVLRTMHDRGHRLFVVSNKPRHISLQILKRECFYDYFEAIVTRDSRWPHYQGKPEMIADLLAERGIARENCLMVGDTIEDANTAATSGIRFAWATYGYGTTVQMTAMPVAYKLESLSQFLPLMTEEMVRD